eukprot:6213560-Pyramimonas_sp.AAC.1
MARMHSTPDPGDFIYYKLAGLLCAPLPLPAQEDPGCTHPPAVDGGALRGEQRRPPTFDHFQQAEGEERAGQDPEGRGGRPEAHVVHDQKWDGGHDGSGRAVWAQLKRRAAGEVSRRTDCVQQTDRQTVRVCVQT